MSSTNQGLALDRFCRLPTPSYEKIYADANRILDDIISQCHTYRQPNQNIDAQELVQFISHGCQILQNASILLRSKFAQVVNINLPQIKNSIDERCVNDLVQFLSQSLSNSKSQLVMEFIKALAVTLAGNGGYLEEENLLMLLAEDGIIWMYLSQTDWIIKGYALQCLGNICLKSSTNDVLEKNYVTLCYSKLLNILRLLILEDNNDVEHLKLITVGLKALQNVLSSISMTDDIVEPEFAVALLKIFLAYRTQSYHNSVERLIKVLPSRKPEDVDSMEKIYPTKRKEKSPMTKKVHAKKSRRKKKNNVSVNLEESFDNLSEDGFGSSYNLQPSWRQAAQSASSSESEYSDSEASQQDRMTSILLKVRQIAATTIQDVLRCCDRRSKFSCWLQLIPDTISNDQPSLLSSLATEHHTKVCTAVLMALMELIDGSKGFLDSVVSPNIRPAASSRPFTPFSVKLNQSINILHETLLTTLHRDQSDILKDKVVKCLTLLMLNSPYKKLGVNYIPDILRGTCKYLLSDDVTLCQSAITCIAACMSVMPDNKDVLKLLQRDAIPSITGFPSFQESSVGEYEDSWLITHCMKELSSAAKDNVRELRLLPEYIQLVTVVLRCHPHLVKKLQRDRLIDLLVNVFLFSSEINVSVHSIKLLEEFSKYFQSMYEKTKDDSEGCVFWKKMLTGAIPQYLNVEPQKHVKGQAAICDWMSNMGSHYFSAMKNPEQIFIKTVLIGLSASVEPLVPAAAVRALGVIIDYTCIKDDVWFVVDVTRSILHQLENPSINIRLKAAWSLANLCDFVGKNEFLSKEYPESLILSLLQYATKASLDNEKISSNGVRALGNLLKFLPKHLFGKENFQETLEEATGALRKNISSGTMKTRWNACYAVRYMFENPDCPIGIASWTDNLYNSLLEALKECKNFKVRISAAVALSSSKERSCYGDEKLFSHIWKETLAALGKSAELTDFTEFKHKDTLQDKTTILLLHLLSLATPTDLKNLRLEVQAYHELFLRHSERCVTMIAGNPEHDVSNTEKESCARQNSVAKEKSKEEQEKIDEICGCIKNMKVNLCSVAQLDDQLPTMDIIRTVLFLVA